MIIKVACVNADTFYSWLEKVEGQNLVKERKLGEKMRKKTEKNIEL